MPECTDLEPDVESIRKDPYMLKQRLDDIEMLSSAHPLMPDEARELNHRLTALLDALATAREERDEWKAAFSSKQLYPISEMEQKLARSEVRLRTPINGSLLRNWETSNP